MTTTIDVATDIRERVDALDWECLRAELDDRGHAVTVPLLTEDECDELSDLFDIGRFRSTIEMARYRFGDGRYRYFDHPLPETIAATPDRDAPRRCDRDPGAAHRPRSDLPRRYLRVSGVARRRPAGGDRGSHHVRVRTAGARGRPGPARRHASNADSWITCMARHLTRAAWTVPCRACPTCLTRHGPSAMRGLT